MRLVELKREAVVRLSRVGVLRPALEADLFLTAAFLLDRVSLYRNPERDVTDSDVEAFRILIRRRENHEPVEYILGKAEFFGLPFSVGPGCLIPRPETELLVEIALEDREEERRFLDWGTGSGCIPVALLSERPFWSGVAVDASPHALTWAWRNFRQYGFLRHCLLVHADHPSVIPLEDQSLDLLISNPPYIPTGLIGDLMPEVKDYEPHVALDGGNNGVAPYFSLFEVAPRWLKPGGRLLVEIGEPTQAERLQTVQIPGLRHIKTCLDLEGRPRAMLWQVHKL